MSPTVEKHARRRLGGVLGVLSLVAGLGFVCWTQLLIASDLSTLERVVFGFLVGGLVAAPYLLIWLACRALRYWLARVLVAIALAGCCLLCVYAFDDLQDGFNLLFAPIYQLAGAFVLLMLATIVDLVWRWHSGRSTVTKGGG